jgi:hypothetical protein
MEASQLFTLCSQFVLIPWLMLLFLPHWRWTEKLIFHAWIPILLGIAYVYAFYRGLPTPEAGGFGSLAEVQVLFSVPWLVVAGWIHYLAFDLFIGAWEVRDAKRRGIHHLLVAPCLILTFMAGPAGLLVYLLIRLVLAKTMTTVEQI